MYALVDANSFYASAEKVFDPAIRHRPVVVLTNNDGCICALCEYAKALGVKKFGPYYKVKGLLAKHNAVIRSSNYELYDYLSNKMMQVIGEFAPDQHIYSIDECFLYFDNWQPPSGWLSHALAIQQAVWQQLRLPVGVGMASTPTLAKAASFAGKRLGDKQGIAVLDSPEKTQAVLQAMHVQDVWGVGKRIAARLEAQGIHTAWALANTCPKALRKQFSVELERTVRELNGTTCIEWDAERANKKQIYSTRAFGKAVTTQQALRESLCWHAEKVAEKLRRQGSKACLLTLFTHANPFANTRQYHKAVQHRFAQPTNDTRALVEAASRASVVLYKAGILLHKCGVGAIEIIDTEQEQQDMFAQLTHNPKVMQCMDAINARYGSQTIGAAAKGIHPQWSMKREYLSPQYTTNWRHLPKIEC
ncbi:Y-family DNA polymerase [Aestuariibacter sp. GS-14]|uniref:Y-family DNA polymerase n=1 Tax=Alteromonadaceae TaxID=72275 RepID=UPI00112EDC9D|nr:Y-family DNA polymerase [Aestuariibacter sp. GS-14]TPV58480.1 Y-family DNA polymerase [Aestuariibacter sp. GS-14]